MHNLYEAPVEHRLYMHVWHNIVEPHCKVHPLGRVKWQYREVTMVSTGVKHIDECTVIRKKLSGYRGFDFTVGWQFAEVEL